MVNRSQKILVLGYTSSAFVLPLANELHMRLPSTEFELLEHPIHEQPKNSGEGGVFSRRHRMPSNRISVGLLANVAEAVGRGLLFRRIRVLFSTEKPSWRRFLREIAAVVRINRFRRGFGYPGRFDLYHFHFCNAYFLQPIEVLPKGAAVICSFWGSDLMRTHGLYEYYYQSRALERADAITVQSIELREILLSKFGRHLRPKVHCAQFPVAEPLFRRIEAASVGGADVEALRSELGLPAGRKVIAIGHNGNPDNQHLAAVAALSLLRNEEKTRIICVFPMTYGMDDAHVKRVTSAATEAGLTHRILTRYLTEAELAALRVLTDLQIHVPISDALSGTLIEVVYAGNCVVAGGWLPYGPFRRAGIPFLTCDDIADLSASVREYLSHSDNLKQESAGARKQVRSHFFPENTIIAWLNIYGKLLER